MSVEMMPDDLFWAIVDQTQPFGAGQAERLSSVLELLPCDNKQAFLLAFVEKSQTAYRWDLWAAGYLYGGGCSDDAFTDFRAGLIGLGRHAYESVLAQPDDLAEQFYRLSDENFLFHEDFGYVPDQVLRDSGCEAPPLKAIFAVKRDADEDAPGWDFDDEDEMRKRFPKLWKAVEGTQ